ncbi:glycosyl transferase family 1 [Actimicrobium sp. CCC2.4]|uniref:glycosyl transferase family 1 n=1 Tax=Actimicrobium sp. CCC2.4 TaxID=3048606 RepID=UPI002AC9C84F|nr:glycosyl transferase family 1 [Actimicrobium sp. CCC2.4]MEB0136050.1 glycosyl transferase family 1 [Actimicrobium sp. CCC2.4]WPX32192.1 glycosyl transferase family 1 [Actimicrobium sp. CCC2.4]
MTDLKFLLTTYSTAFTTSGGGESEQVQISEILNEHGVKADIYGVGSRPLNYYDGIIHFSVHPDGWAIVQEALIKHKKVVLFPNVWWNESPSNLEITRITEFCNNANIIIFKSQSELNNFIQYIPIQDNKIRVLFAGISDRFLSPVDLDVFCTISDVSDFVLCMGLIEPIKNQLQVIRALNKLNMNGVFVGGMRDYEYYLQCTKEAHAGIVFFPFIQPCSVLLRSMIANCNLMVEISLDPPARSSLEGALLKKSLILSDGEWQREHFENDVWYAPTNSDVDLAKVIEQVVISSVERENMISAAYQRVIGRHTAKAFGSLFVRILAKESV